MALAGDGAVAIWHDIAPEGRRQFYEWHGREHMPERVAIPGFRRGRRYAALDADLEYFNLYEANSLSVVSGPDYRERLDNPTPWTLSTVRHFRKVARSICRVAASLGPGQGGLVATLRYDVAEGRADAHLRFVREELLPALVEDGYVAGAHLLVADTAASAVDNAERKMRGEENRIPSWIAVVEGWGDDAPFIDLCRARLADEALARHGLTGPPALGFYRLQATALAE